MLNKINIALLIALSMTFSANLPLPFGTQTAAAKNQSTHQTIVVENTTELLAAIGSNRTIVLKPNTYNLDKNSSRKTSAYFTEV